MTGTEVQFRAEEMLIASDAIKCLHAGPYLPKDLFPWQALLAHEGCDLLWLEIVLFFMCCDLSTVYVYVDLCTFANCPLGGCPCE